MNSKFVTINENVKEHLRNPSLEFVVVLVLRVVAGAAIFNDVATHAEDSVNYLSILIKPIINSQITAYRLSLFPRVPTF